MLDSVDVTVSRLGAKSSEPQWSKGSCSVNEVRLTEVHEWGNHVSCIMSPAMMSSFDELRCSTSLRFPILMDQRRCEDQDYAVQLLSYGAKGVRLSKQVEGRTRLCRAI